MMWIKPSAGALVGENSFLVHATKTGNNNLGLALHHYSINDIETSHNDILNNISADNWYHIAYSINNERMVIYLDGKIISKRSKGPCTLDIGVGGLVIG